MARTAAFRWRVGPPEIVGALSQGSERSDSSTVQAIDGDASQWALNKPAESTIDPFESRGRRAAEITLSLSCSAGRRSADEAAPPPPDRK